MSIILLFCTQLSVDLILSPRDSSRLDIHPYRVYYTYINMITMDARFYSILQSKVKISLFCLNGQPTNMLFLSDFINLTQVHNFTVRAQDIFTFCRLPVFTVSFTRILQV